MSKATPTTTKFATIDERYKARRAELSEQKGPVELWDVIDHWPLYAGVVNLARNLAITDLLRSTLGVPGDVAEFGSWRGSTLMLLAKTLRIFDPYGPKLVHCFDSFEGLTEFSAEDGDAESDHGKFAGNLAELSEMISLYDMNDEIPLHIGVIENTLPDLLADRPELTFSFIYCDTDLYESTATILNRAWPRLARGGVIAFDEWNYEIWPGEGRAVNEFLAGIYGDCSVEAVPNTRQPSLVMRKQ